MRPVRFLALLLSAGLLGLPALVLGAGAASATDYSFPTTTILSASRSTAVYKDPLTLTGQIQVDGGTPDSTGALTDATVTLLRRWRGTTTWRKLGTAVTDSTGRYSFSQVARRNATYRVSYPGETRIVGTNSYTFAPSTANATLFVARDLNARDIQPRPNHFYIKGNVNPGWGHKTVFLQRKTCRSCHWKGYAKQRTTSTGGYRFPVDFPRKGAWFYRVKVPATTPYIASFSQQFRAYVI